MFHALNLGVVYHHRLAIEAQEVDDKRREKDGVAFGAAGEIEPGEKVTGKEGSDITLASALSKAPFDFAGRGIVVDGVERKILASLQLQSGSRAQDVPGIGSIRLMAGRLRNGLEVGGAGGK